jgi:hypothetical protein
MVNNRLQRLLGCVLICFSFLPSSIFAQPEADFNKFSKQYPNERGVVLENVRSAKITLKNNELKIAAKETKSFFILTDKPNYFSEGTIYFSEQMKLVNFNAYSLIPDGKKYKKISVEKYEDTFDSDEGIFYDESKKRSFVFPSLTQGSKVYQEHTIQIEDPHYFGKFFFESYLPTEKSVFEVIAPNDVEFTVFKLGKDADKIVYTQEKEGKNTIHRWSMNNLKPLKSQENAVSLSYYSPHIIISIDRYKTSDGKTVEVTPNLKALFKWYSSLLDRVDMTVSPEIKQISDSVTQGKTTEIERLKSIYYWVQDNIKYIAFEHGIEGIVPRDPHKILAKRYGDCKDMAILIYTMAKSVGINTYPTWIGSRDIPYRYDSIPSMQIDNHMIVTYIDSLNRTYFLDATSDLLDINHPSSFIQGKQGLIYRSKDDYMLKMVPEVDASENCSLDSITLRLQGDSLIGEGVMKVSGYVRQSMARNLIGLSSENMLYNLGLFTQKGNNKYHLDTAFYNTLDRDSMLTVHYRFVIKDYVTMNGDEVFINLNMDKELKNEKIDLEQTPYPIFQIMKMMWESSYTLIIPEGYKVEYVPQNYDFKNSNVSATGIYAVEKDHITLKHKGMINYLTLPVESFVEFNGIIKKVNQAFNQSISLKKMNKTSK